MEEGYYFSELFLIGIHVLTEWPLYHQCGTSNISPTTETQLCRLQPDVALEMQHQAVMGQTKTTSR